MLEEARKRLRRIRYRSKRKLEDLIDSVRIRKLKVTADDMYHHFSNITEERLRWFEEVDLDEYISPYQFVLGMIACSKEYHVAAFVTESKGKETRYYCLDRRKKRKEMFTRTIPDDVFIDLKEEWYLASKVLRGFKKIVQVKHARSTDDLKQSVQETYEALEELSAFHRTNKVHPYIINRPPSKLSKFASTRDRNQVYQVANVLS